MDLDTAKVIIGVLVINQLATIVSAKKILRKYETLEAKYKALHDFTGYLIHIIDNNEESMRFTEFDAIAIVALRDRFKEIAD